MLVLYRQHAVVAVTLLSSYTTYLPQVWQWVHHGASTSDGTKITPRLVRGIAEKATTKLLSTPAAAANGGGKFRLAGRMTADMMTAPELDDFLTSVAYPHIVDVAHCRL